MTQIVFALDKIDSGVAVVKDLVGSFLVERN